jgi:hypothetical protein
MSAPPGADRTSRVAREQCWEKRDAYFACLDSHGTNQTLLVDKPSMNIFKGILHVEDEAKIPEKCRDVHKLYIDSCLPSWVSLLYGFFFF